MRRNAQLDSLTLRLWILKNTSKLHTPSQICEHLKVTPSTLRRLCLKLFGKTAGQLLWQIRLLKAKILIMKAAFPNLTDLSMECGFKSLSHFSRRFKEKYGISPYIYKQKFFRTLSEH